MPCPKTPDKIPLRCKPIRWLPHLCVLDRTHGSELGFEKEGISSSLVSGFSCRGLPLLQMKSISQICHENRRGEDLGAAQRIPNNSSKTAVAVWLCAQECDTNGPVPRGTLGVPSAAPQHQLPLPLLPPAPTLKSHQC